ncbi:Sterol desaturase/sphingolipid hydroxylase, fatty acid hydroxylase superfamily [Chishuiella changwenlii]|uniref:Sterol desaturase n=1 Tax=Chishuiella changwenlii TaxID=1434701 RepID=A0A1M6T661_9FLAO|nr:sterol desaturase family protein [Chishuiella changwenlii]GGE94986.1 sterol desaturase [Chishuiella changwenlii]SHK52465.1 Sterol desaturase/sphingolipid hydroxylase, fatty acid hydroxylase superfamily [Chishuiella changwenlii]
MENSAYLAFAIPAFFLFVWLEYKIAKRKKMKNVFKYESSISNISIGIAERLLNLFITGSFYQLFIFIYDNYRLFTLPNTWWIWIVMLLATDFVWYWYHRLGHEINIFWGAHIVHHQSEEFNYTVAARITTLQAIVRNVFWCVLPFVGFHPSLVMAILVVHGVYSFFTHTQVIGKLGWLEHILITPSLHGVHHASDEKYLDKNYGDVFVFWDKLFGTFQAEEEKPNYGLTHPIKSYSFLWQHFHYYLELYEAAKRQQTIKGKLKIYFGSPAVMDQDIRPEIEKKWLSKNKKDGYHFPFKTYLNIQVFVAFSTMLAMTYFYSSLDSLTLLTGTAFVLITLINIGAQLEQKRWVPYLEHIRFLIFSLFIIYESGYYYLLIFPFILILIIERIFNFSKWYQQKVLKIF